MPSASFSLGTEVDNDVGGAKVGYLTDVSRRQVVISRGEAFVKSAMISRYFVLVEAYSLFSSARRPASSLDNALAAETSFMPPRQASNVFHNSRRTCCQHS